MFPSLTGYGWNGTRYYDLDTGQFVSNADVLGALESVIDQSALNMNALSLQLQNGEISIASWQSSMMQEIKISHLASTTAANGGWAQMTQADWGFAGSQIKEQYRYLNNFAQQIANGEQPLDGRFMVRTDLYGDASRDSYEAQRFRLMEQSGFEEELWELDPSADHCDGCLEQAGKGWVPLGELDNIGDEDCQVRCRCTKRYRRLTESGEWEENE